MGCLVSVGLGLWGGRRAAGRDREGGGGTLQQRSPRSWPCALVTSCGRSPITGPALLAPGVSARLEARQGEEQF